MRKLRLLRPLLVLLVLAIVAAAQDAPKQITTIRDVEVGMERDRVLAGLSGNYTLTKQDLHIDNSEVWVAKGKNPADLETARLVFWEGKVDLVTIDLYPAATGEAFRLAQRLFLMLYDRAEPPPSPNRIDKLANRRSIVVPIELQDIRSDQSEDLNIGLTLDKRHFSIHITKSEGSPDKVELVESIERP
jgi:hypothetical protein